jgi:hypothetical protein
MCSSEESSITIQLHLCHHIFSVEQSFQGSGRGGIDRLFRDTLVIPRKSLNNECASI